MAAPPGGGERKTTMVNRKALDTGERLSIYGFDLDNLKFDLGDSSQNRGSVRVEDDGVATMWKDGGKSVKKVEHVEDAAAMFGNFEINVNSSAKAGTELGFEFKAILDNDYGGFSADDYDVEIDAAAIVMSGVSQCWECQKSIQKAADGVTAFGKVYHRACVKCAGTGKDFSAGGDAYEGTDGKVYCKAEWEKRFQKTCEKCKLPIKDKVPLEAKDKFYHRKCFRCQVCDNVLDGRWYEEDGKPICENDYYRKRGLVCPCCNTHVDGDGKKVGKFKFHHKCYNCAYCRREPEGFFKQIDRKPNRIYCAPCFERIFPNE